MRFDLSGPLAVTSMSNQAAFTISIERANPAPADTIVATIRDSSPTCPVIIPRATRFSPPSQIRIEYARISNCEFGPFSGAKTTIGRLPPERER